MMNMFFALATFFYYCQQKIVNFSRLQKTKLMWKQVTQHFKANTVQFFFKKTPWTSAINKNFSVFSIFFQVSSCEQTVHYLAPRTPTY